MTIIKDHYEQSTSNTETKKIDHNGDKSHDLELPGFLSMFNIIIIITMCMSGMVLILSSVDTFSDYNAQIDCIINSNGTNTDCIIIYYSELENGCPENYTLKLFVDYEEIFCVYDNSLGTAANVSIISSCIDYKIDDIFSYIPVSLIKITFILICLPLIIIFGCSLLCYRNFDINQILSMQHMSFISEIVLLLLLIILFLEYFINYLNVTSALEYTDCYDIINLQIFYTVQNNALIGMIIIGIFIIMVTMMLIIYYIFLQKINKIQKSTTTNP